MANGFFENLLAVLIEGLSHRLNDFVGVVRNIHFNYVKLFVKYTY
jgi:hypothetical protein